MESPPLSSESLEERLQRLRAQYAQAKGDFQSSRIECARLQTVLWGKQRVIELLLPYYPRPITPAMRYLIDAM